MQSNASKTKIKKTKTNKYGMGDDLKTKTDSLIKKYEDSSSEKLKKIKDQQETDDFMENKKRLWLKAEKKRKKREEEENKFKFSILAKEKEKEEQKKNIEEKIDIKSQILEEQRKQFENEKNDIGKAQIRAKKKILEENDILSKEAERQRRLETLKEEEDEEWRKKINKEFALKMGYKINSNIVNRKNEYSMCNNGNKRLTKYADKILKEIKQNNLVFDPGNLMKQIIKRELSKAENKKVKN